MPPPRGLGKTQRRAARTMHRSRSQFFAVDLLTTAETTRPVAAMVNWITTIKPSLAR